MAVYFTSDLHLGHKNFVRGTSTWPDTSECRDFDTIEEHDQTIINAINAVAGPKDTLYHLGDFCFVQKKANDGWRTIRDYRRQLNVGWIVFLMGNHDKVGQFMKDEGQIINSPYLELKGSNGVPEITLCHYAMRVWNKSHFGTWHLYGHSHGRLPDDPNSLSMDVGVDTRPDWRPYSIDEIAAHMATKTFVPIHQRS